MIKYIKPLKAANAAISGVATQDLTDTFLISDLDSLHISVDIVYSAATVAGGSITATLVSSVDGGANFDFTHSSVTITAAASRTVKSIVLHIHASGHQGNLPVRGLAKIIIASDNAGNSATIDEVYVSRRTRN